MPQALLLTLKGARQSCLLILTVLVSHLQPLRFNDDASGWSTGLLLLFLPMSSNVF